MIPHPSHNNDQLKKVFDEYWKSLCFFSYKLVGDWSDAEDIVQSAFLLLHKGNDYRNPRYFLFKTVKDRSLNFLKKSKRRKEIIKDVSFQLKDFEECAESNMVRTEMIRRLYEAVPKLFKKYRDVIVLILQGKDSNQVCSILGITDSGFRMLKKRAIEQLALLAGFDRKKGETQADRRSRKIVELDGDGNYLKTWENGTEIRQKEGDYIGRLVINILTKNGGKYSTLGRYFMYESEYNKLNGINQQP